MEIEEVLTTLGYEPEKIKTIDDFKTAIETDFVRKDQIEAHPEIINPILGKTLGSIETNFVRGLKGLNIEMSKDEIKDKKLSDIFTIAFPKIKDHYDSEIKTLKEQAGKGNDEKVVQAQKEISDWQKKFGDLEGLHKSTIGELETIKTKHDQEKQSEKLNNHFQAGHNSVKWKTGMTELETEGIKSVMNKKYKVSFDDKGTEELSDISGNRIKHPTKIGTWLTYAEAYAMEADKANLTQKNDKRSAITPNRSIDNSRDINANQPRGRMPSDLSQREQFLKNR